MMSDYCFVCIAHEMFLHVSDGFISGYTLEVKSLKFTYKSSQLPLMITNEYDTRASLTNNQDN